MSRNSSFLEEPLLGSAAEVDSEKALKGCKCGEVRSCRRYPSAAIIYFVFLHLAVALLLLEPLIARPASNLGLLPDELVLARDAIQYRSIRFTASGFNTTSAAGSPYEGRPSASNNVLWSSLVDVGMYVMTATEYEQVDFKTAQLHNSNGSHYLVMLEVFHQLHCLNVLRLQVYQPGGLDSLREQVRVEKEIHLNHCVDYLRQVLMCHGDMTPITVKTKEGHWPPYEARFDIRHTCRDFDQLHEFAAERNSTGITI